MMQGALNISLGKEGESVREGGRVEGETKGD